MLKGLDVSGGDMGPEYVHRAKEAYTLGMKAWRASIERYQSDVGLAEPPGCGRSRPGAAF